ncbi:hypothetical protein PTTG_25829 [Puccinia triticina 1-1 BBBD Race 1]|uniref:DUF6589 domain-containing protein n=1 Tax=Puccinia triticina (isolate 1-1 / race 1 (BBBD)) TaxID=630390 RepID=A0A180H039_PUCT1|nr:hypothetical protein PTTG_25829 [Puccinia triticina 1-1 BBBD Race 1]
MAGLPRTSAIEELHDVDELYEMDNHSNIQPPRTEAKKILHICKELQKMKMTPKVFITGFLCSNDSDVAFQRQYWRTGTGLEGALEVVRAVKTTATSTPKGAAMWKEFIKDEAVEILRQERPPSGYYPNGSFYSSQEIGLPFFTPKAALERKRLLTEEHTPFLFTLLKRTMNDGDEDDNGPSEDRHNKGEDALLNLEGIEIEPSPTPVDRKTKTAMKLNESFPLGPSLCIDNVNMEQRVHTHSIGHQSMMFHGTWGYIHHPPPSLLASVDHTKFTLDPYYTALSHLPDFEIQPSLLLPTYEENIHFEEVLKSQIAQVMYHYIAQPLDPKLAISRKPPPIDPIDCLPPKIQMLKLMEASDNSAEGFGQVIKMIINQIGLKPEEFCSRVQLIDGDLGTSQNFNSLRTLRTPSNFPDHQLHNISFQLGASHTLWNIAQSILTAHFGDQERSNDLGAWQYLHALGIPPEKAIPKKDFTLMMGTKNEPIPNVQPKIATTQWNKTIEACYTKNFSPKARRAT